MPPTNEAVSSIRACRMLPSRLSRRSIGSVAVGAPGPPSNATIAARWIGIGLWKGGDAGLIDGVVINGSAHAVGGVAGLVRRLQTGLLPLYALVMIVGVVGLMTWKLWPYIEPQFKALLGQ